jgi:hypothetical protein
MTNNDLLHYSSFFRLKIRYDADDDNNDDDDANDDSTTALYRPLRLFLKISNVKPGETL